MSDKNRYCSPSRKYNKLSCFSYMELVELAKAYNNYIEKNNVSFKKKCILNKKKFIFQKINKLYTLIYIIHLNQLREMNLIGLILNL